MVERRMINSVLRKVTAGKEDTGEVPAQRPGEAPADRVRYYFYDAPPTNSIQFTNLTEILSGDSPEKQALIKKLQGGNTGKYYADYFVWKKICVRTNEYSTDGKSYIVYECGLTPLGTKMAGTERVLPKGAPVKPEMIEKDLLLFEDKSGNSQAINPDQTGESFYIDQDPPSNIAQVLMSGAVPPGKRQNYDMFSRKFDEYRIFVPNIRQLMLPSFDSPTNDGIKGGHYKGGEQAYRALLKSTGASEQPQQTQEQPAQEETMKKEETAFEPAGEKRVPPVQGDIIDKTASKKKKKSKGDYSSEPYSGGTDVMQRLFYDQSENMDIRRMASRVAQMSLTAQTTSTQPTQPAMQTTKTKYPTIPILDDPDNNRENAKKLEGLAEMQDKFKTEYERVQQKAQQAQKGFAGKTVAASSVVVRFLKS